MRILTVIMSIIETIIGISPRRPRLIKRKYKLQLVYNVVLKNKIDDVNLGVSKLRVFEELT